MKADAIKDRLYWTPAQCARLLGHGRDWWAEQMDLGRVTGYRHGSRGDRKILAESAKGLLENMSTLAVETRPQAIDIRQTMEAWRKRRAATQRQAGQPQHEQRGRS